MTEAPDLARADEAERTDDGWQRSQATASTRPGAVVAWVALMALLLGGLALMGASFADGNGVVFTAGLLVSGLAFLVPLAVLGRAER